MVINNFSFFGNPQLVFGAGKFNSLVEIILGYGKNVLLVVGGNSLEKSGNLKKLTENLGKKEIVYFTINVKTEPTADLVDTAVKAFKDKNIDLVVAIGGGSVIDAGKAISAMLPYEESIKEFLEGIGSKTHTGKKIPFIAIPTTAGTGSEATKNAVISEVGENGYKKSLRHDNFIPDIALIDPELALNCPKNITAASGMDALTQLIESFVSPKSSIMTDVMALEGLDKIISSLERAYANGNDLEARADMAFGAYLSGVTLLNAGLGIVHGFASSVGGYFDIPHGIICGTLLAESTKINIKCLRENNDYLTLHKYARIGYLFIKTQYDPEKNLEEGLELLISNLERLTEVLHLEKLGKFGVTKSNIEKVCRVTENKNNPVKLNYEEIYQILERRI